MIRYVHVGGQVDEGDDVFALFDTVANRFVTIAEQQLWEDTNDLGLCCREAYEPMDVEQRLVSVASVHPKPADDRIHGYDPLTYWALAALARLSDAHKAGRSIGWAGGRQTADERIEVLEKLDDMYTMTREEAEFAEVWKHVDGFEALHTDADLDALDD